ncbi:MAG: DUF3575 domain-containing protein [Bacteroidota bacterium]
MKQKMTKCLGLFVMLAFIFSAGTVNAQEEKNLVKWNLAALALKNFSFQYERAVGKKISVAGGLRFAPKSKLPFKSSLEKAIDDDETWESIKEFKTGNFAITPEVRFYMGKNVFQGFYIAPFVRYAQYSAEVPYKFDVEGNEEVIPLSGNVSSITGGVLFGAQWKLAKKIHLDWWILGPNYGSTSGSVTGKKTLNIEEQESLRDELQNLEEDLPLVKTKYTVDGNGVKVDFDGPWAGVRAGLSLGFRF